MASVQVRMIISLVRLYAYLDLVHVEFKLIILWVDSTLGGSHGVPRVHYKGKQGDYYVMVR